MSRTVPAELQTHLNGAATTTTRLLRITTKAGASFGLSMLPSDIDYDDGDGLLTYRAASGFDPSALANDLGFTVSNTEGRALLSADLDITLEMVQAGELDDATWRLYLVNFADLTAGRHVLLDAGDLGEVRTQFAMVWIPELVGYGMRLRQPVGSVWSRTCRAEFGTPADGPKGCGVNSDAYWFNGSVSAVGAETNRVFTGTAADDSNALTLQPGVLEWLTGDNAGKRFGVEEVNVLVLTLAEATPYPIQVGDTYRARPDCAKRFLEDCRDKFNNAVNFKGEPHIPVGDSSGVQAPGAQLPRAGGYVGRGGLSGSSSV